MLRNQIEESNKRNFRFSIGIPILAVAICAWCISIFVFHSSSNGSAGHVVPLVPIMTMERMFNSLDPRMMISFVLMWEIGMTAMMFPALVPVMSVYQSFMIRGKKSVASRAAKSSLFVGGYLLLYCLQGFLVFILVYGAFQLGAILELSSSLSVLGLAGVLFATGFWQLTPLKESCLSKCVSPIGFFVRHAKDGKLGAIRMGAINGFYCAGCCWMYSIVMLVVAAMSLLSMVLLTGLIIVEKAFLGKTKWFKWFSAVIFFSLGSMVIIFPSLLL